MEELLKQLYDETTVEDLQKKTGKNINTMNLKYHRSIVPEIPQADFFKYGNIAINKHARFSYTPAHTHSFIEINYVLNGQCTQRLNGEKFLLKKDQLVIFFQAANAENEHNNYILLDASKSELSKKLFFALLLAGYNRTNGDKRLLINLLYCALMVEISSIPIISTNKKLTINDPLIQILKYINDHYTTITLKSLGKKFGYNKNYLSNLLKDKTGSSFQELIDQKRVSEAKRLMSETEDSLSTIAMKIGYKSVPSIFKLFKKETGQTPNFFRNEHSN